MIIFSGYGFIFPFLNVSALNSIYFVISTTIIQRKTVGE